MKPSKDAMRILESHNKINLFHFVIVLSMAAWTGILFGLYLWAAGGEREHFAETVKLKALSLANYTQALRGWIGEHGGVYIEIDDKITPHPLLAHVPERDIETPSGRKLTLLNSPSVLHEISRDFNNGEGNLIRLVSNRPMNPTNMPDDWEKKALIELEAGEADVQGFASDGRSNLFRLMYPMKLKPKCLDCHHYSTGDPQKIVGGLSVIVDKTPYDKLSEKMIRKISTGYLGVWIIGLFGLAAFDFTGARLLRNIEFTATHDGLTRLKNRWEIERLLNLERERASRSGNSMYAMMLDIDNFKRVNDTFGHQAGDEALRAVAEAVRQTIRKTDIAGRYGGEELLVLASNLSYDGAKMLAQRLNATIKATPIRLQDGKTISVTASIGVSCYSAERTSSASIIKSADEALYKAKESGRDCVCIFFRIIGNLHFSCYDTLSEGGAGSRISCIQFHRTHFIHATKYPNDGHWPMASWLFVLSSPGFLFFSAGRGFR